MFFLFVQRYAKYSERMFNLSQDMLKMRELPQILQFCTIIKHPAQFERDAMLSKKIVLITR